MYFSSVFPIPSFSPTIPIHLRSYPEILNPPFSTSPERIINLKTSVTERPRKYFCAGHAREGDDEVDSVRRSQLVGRRNYVAAAGQPTHVGVREPDTGWNLGQPIRGSDEVSSHLEARHQGIWRLAESITLISRLRKAACGCTKPPAEIPSISSAHRQDG
ncbi:hypothetical protein DFH09DRAFT_1078516 [Mycena vulgaris]|nr:hypothetical protein DFH09DRAFT_1078516 [Mycena vulgaris]